MIEKGRVGSSLNVSSRSFYLILMNWLVRFQQLGYYIKYLTVYILYCKYCKTYHVLMYQYMPLVCIVYISKPGYGQVGRHMPKFSV